MPMRLPWGGVLLVVLSMSNVDGTQMTRMLRNADFRRFFKELGCNIL
jgi:hypothetical protein